MSTNESTNQYRKIFQSSNLQQGDYDPITQTLTLTFTSGRTYTYTGVPESKWVELRSTPNSSVFFRTEIAPNHAYKEIKDESGTK